MYNIISRNVKEARKAERVRVRVHVRVRVCLMDAYTSVWEMNKNIIVNVYLWSGGKNMRRGTFAFYYKLSLHILNFLS